MKKIIFISIAFLSVELVYAQEKVTLEYCYERVEQEFPTAQKAEIQREITNLNMMLKQTGLYPEMKINGSISYQSETTDPSFAGPAAPDFSKDHYNISLDLTQLVFDAGRTKKLKEVELISGETAQAGIQVELWNIRKQIDQVYFGILLIQKQLELTELFLKDLEEQLHVVSARVENGVLLSANERVIQAEILKLKQQRLQIEANIKSGYEVLSVLIGEEVSVDEQLDLPEKYIDWFETEEEINRPEIKVFDRRKNTLDAQSEVISSDKLPVVSAFAKGAYGRPGFDAFNDDLHLYWMVGLRAQWSFRNWRNSEKKRQVIQLEQDKIGADQDAFTRQVNTALSQIKSNIEALNQQITLDEQLLELQKEIVEEKKSQLNQGVITSTEYVTELNAQNRTLLNLEIHKVQLVQAHYEYLTQKGISWN
ncbi:MAG: TolC family protein [Balneolaceae bacterium]|nr:TolC family protein [Balneolaceae bacterium]MBO6547660.1 TolC family protein [Balneolaceae bacterium]MBO6648171.1 TolC family protein [Balneolaceae bacterium]